MRTRVLPTPLLSLALLAFWLVLGDGVGPLWLAGGVALAVLIPHLLPPLMPRGVRVRRPLTIVRYLGVVIHDVVESNLMVAADLFRLRRRRPRPAFVEIALDLRDPTGLAVLAMVTTIVPGTVWSELARDRRALLLHVWDAPEPDAFAAFYKARYEAPLREIFE